MAKRKTFVHHVDLNVLREAGRGSASENLESKQRFESTGHHSQAVPKVRGEFLESGTNLSPTKYRGQSWAKARIKQDVGLANFAMLDQR